MEEGEKRTQQIPYYRFFIVLLLIQGVVAFNRDFIQSQRYGGLGEWTSDLIPAVFGLIVAAAINSLVIYGIYRLYKGVTRKKAQDK